MPHIDTSSRGAIFFREHSSGFMCVQLAAYSDGLATQLSQHAPAPWDELLGSHREAFVSLTTQIQDVASGNRELLTSSHRAAQETILGLQETVHTYDTRGTASTGTATAAHRRIVLGGPRP